MRRRGDADIDGDHGRSVSERARRRGLREATYMVGDGEIRLDRIGASAEAAVHARMSRPRTRRRARSGARRRPAASDPAPRSRERPHADHILGFVSPLPGQSGGRRRRQPAAGAEQLLQRRAGVSSGQTMQIQERKFLGDLRRFPRPGWQDRRGKPVSFSGFRIHPLIVRPRRFHPHRARRGEARTTRPSGPA